MPVMKKPLIRTSKTYTVWLGPYGIRFWGVRKGKQKRKRIFIGKDRRRIKQEVGVTLSEKPASKQTEEIYFGTKADRDTLKKRTRKRSNRGFQKTSVKGENAQIKIERLLRRRKELVILLIKSQRTKKSKAESIKEWKEQLKEIEEYLEVPEKLRHTKTK